MYRKLFFCGSVANSKLKVGVITWAVDSVDIFLLCVCRVGGGNWGFLSIVLWQQLRKLWFQFEAKFQIANRPQGTLKCRNNLQPTLWWELRSILQASLKLFLVVVAAVLAAVVATLSCKLTVKLCGKHAWQAPQPEQLTGSFYALFGVSCTAVRQTKAHITQIAYTHIHKYTCTCYTYTQPAITPTAPILNKPLWGRLVRAKVYSMLYWIINFYWSWLHTYIHTHTGCARAVQHLPLHTLLH